MFVNKKIMNSNNYKNLKNYLTPRDYHSPIWGNVDTPYDNVLQNNFMTSNSNYLPNLAKDYKPRDVVRQFPMDKFNLVENYDNLPRTSYDKKMLAMFR